MVWSGLFKKVIFSGFFLLSPVLYAQIERFSKQIEENPQKLENYFYRGREFVLKGDYNAAIEDLTHVLEHDSRHFEARFFRAIAYFETGELVLAEQDALFARDIKEADARLNAVLGIIYMQKQEYYRAADFFTRQVQLDSENPQAYINRAWALLMLPSYTEMALQDYDEALKYNAENLIALYNRVEPLRMLDRLDEAEATLTQAIHLDPSEVGFYFRRGNIRAQQGNYERSLADHLQVIRLASEEQQELMINSIVQIANLYLVTGNWQESLFYSEAAIELSKGTHATAFVLRGKALIAQYQAGCLTPDASQEAAGLSCQEIEQQIHQMFDLAIENGFPSRVYLDRRLSQMYKQ